MTSRPKQGRRILKALSVLGGIETFEATLGRDAPWT